MMRKILLIGFIIGLLVAFGAPIAGWLFYGNIALKNLTWNTSWFLIISGVGFTVMVICGIRLGNRKTRLEEQEKNGGKR